jgi:transposase
MQAITTIGLDIAKSVFQIHGVDDGGQVVIRRQLKRRYVFAYFQNLPPCLVGIEACASAHYWEAAALLRSRASDRRVVVKDLATQEVIDPAGKSLTERGRAVASATTARRQSDTAPLVR